MELYKIKKKKIEKFRYISFFDVIQKIKLKIKLFDFFMFFTFFIIITYILYIILSLFFNVSFTDIFNNLKDEKILKSIFITILSLVISISLIIILGIPSAYLISTKNNKIYKMLNIIASIPLLIPPSVAGIAMLIAFGRKSIFYNISGINLIFNFISVIMVQVFISFPIFLQMVKQGFDDIEKEIIEAAMVDGAGQKEIILKMYVPISAKHIFAGIFLSVLRAAGEFGATLMFAGNVSGKTQTVTTLIYTISNTDMKKALALSLIHIFIFVIPFLVIKYCNRSCFD